MSESIFVINEAGFHHVFQSWDGPVGRNIAARARSLENKAVASAGLKSGALRVSITSFFTHHSSELAVRVGANPQGGSTGYALWHHEGTEPHIIRAAPGKKLRFESNGEIRYASVVHHPGTQPNPYLTRWLREAVS